MFVGPVYSIRGVRIRDETRYGGHHSYVTFYFGAALKAAARQWLIERKNMQYDQSQASTALLITNSVCVCFFFFMHVLAIPSMLRTYNYSTSKYAFK